MAAERSFTSSFNMLKAFAGFALFLALSVYALTIINETYARSVVPLNNAFSQQRFVDFYALERDSLDMVFVGSSHSYCSFDPENFDSELGTNTFQMGMPLQHPDATFYTLLEVFNYQKPTVVVMEVYWAMLAENFSLYQYDTLFDVLDNEDLKRDYFEKIFPINEKIKYSLGLFKNQTDFYSQEGKNILSDWEEKYSIPKYSTGAVGGEFYRSKGYTVSDMVMWADEFGRTNQFNGKDGRNFEIAPKQREYLEKIVRLCEDNGAKLVFVTAPIANDSMERILYYEEINKVVAGFAAKHNIPYIDYNMPDSRPPLEFYHFRDDAHLNDAGVQVLDSYFIDFLVEHEIFTKE